jgi:Xaa-Pro aminopeptidase
MFPADTYCERRDALARYLGGGLLLFLGNSESPMNYADNCYRFRQDSSFLYFFGLDHPDLAAVIDLDEGRTIVFGNELTIDDIVWMGFQPTLADRAQRAGVTETRPAAALHDYLRQARERNRKVHFLPPYRAANRILLSQLLGVHLWESAQEASIDLVRAVVALRAVKTTAEVDAIEEAVNTSVDMHTAAMRMARPGMKEAAIAAEVERIALAAGGRTSFPVIATVNGQILHNHAYEGTLQSGDLFLLDAGAECSLGYAGDLSSTFPVDPVFTERQKTIYELALAAHEAAIAALAPGVPNLTVHLAAARTIAAGMKGLGLMTGDVDEAVAAGAHAMFFPCGVGHMMGLDVHDMEDLGEVQVGYDGRAKSTQFGLKSLRLARPLEPGFVLTVEPGIYFIPQLIDRWRAEKRFTAFLNYDELEKWRDFGGLRNEENFLITTDGARRLGRPKPKTVAAVEALRTG